MKNIKMKRIHAYIMASGLRRTPPKEFPDLDEMTTLVDSILPVFDPAIGEFLLFRKQAEKLSNDLALGNIEQPAAEIQMKDIQKQVRKYELGDGEKEVEIALEDGHFGVLSKQFARWGKNWFDKIEDFVAMKNAMKNIDSK